MKWAKLHPSLRKCPFHSHHPLKVCIGEIIHTWEVGAGLGWVAAASGSVTGPEFTETREVTMSWAKLHSSLRK
jgi:hypothetical protein